MILQNVLKIPFKYIFFLKVGNEMKNYSNQWFQLSHYYHHSTSVHEEAIERVKLLTTGTLTHLAVSSY